MSNDNPAFAPPTRDQLQADVRISAAWRDAVKAGTFAGKDAESIATLVQFLQDQHEKALTRYEEAAKSRPEWGVNSAKVAAGC
jgi:hypothetical protein